MNKYMRAIGFSRYKKREQMNSLFEAACKEPDIYHAFVDSERDILFELTKMTGQGIGLTWSGTMEGRETLCEYCFPVVEGEEYFIKESVSVEERVMGDAYTGAFEDLRAGVFIIFFLQNGIDYLEMQQNIGGRGMTAMKVALSGLALSGTILLPLVSDEQRCRKRDKEQRQRIKLLAAAKQGDEKAMESLAFQDMDMYTKVSKRILTEDVFSIVESSFMPYGIECDQYSIVADIIRAEKIINTFTKEEVWKLKLNYNGIFMDICINNQDLMGEPAPGRRFKGNLWLQGKIKCD